MHLFGFADINALGDSVHTLAEQECRSPPLVPLKLDDVLAFTEWIGDGRPFQVRVGFAFARLILPKEAAKSQRALARSDCATYMSPKNLTCVFLPPKIIQAFFPVHLWLVRGW